jgi:hypothetical protein
MNFPKELQDKIKARIAARADGFSGKDEGGKLIPAVRIYFHKTTAREGFPPAGPAKTMSETAIMLALS